MRELPFVLLVALVAEFTLAGATKEPPSPLPSGIQERVAVHIVQMPLIATDRQGRPIRDLRPEEIHVKFRGRPARVSYLEPLRVVPSPDRSAADVRLYLEAPGGWSEPARSGPAERYVVFLVDVENDTLLRRQEQIRAAVAFVRSRLEPSARASVFSYDGSLNLELPFTDDRNALESAILTASSRTGRPRLDPGARMRRLIQSMEACVESGDQFEKTADSRCLRDLANEYSGEANARAKDFIGALNDLSSYLGGLRGRKTVIALSHGLPVDAGTVLVEAARALFGNADIIADLQRYVGFGSPPRQEMDRLLNSIVRNRVAISFVDRLAPPTGDSQASRGEMLAPGMFPMEAEYNAAVTDMEQISTSSGGLHIHSTDLAEGLRQAIDVLDASYDLGFELAEYADSKALSKVSVSCSRRGVKLSHSRGVDVPRPQQEPVMRGRFVLGRTTPLPEERAPAVRQPFLLEVDPREIGYDLQGDEAQATFTVHLAVLSSSSEQLVDTFHFVNHSYDAAGWKEGDLAPMTLRGWVEGPPGDYILRVWVRNVRTGREGGITGLIKIAGSPRAVSE